MYFQKIELESFLWSISKKIYVSDSIINVYVLKTYLTNINRESPGIFINEDMLSGYSLKSKTYKNDILTSNKDGLFQIQNIEVWNPIQPNLQVCGF